jgi:Mg2+ and Co2+ transporter CorA
MDAYINETPKSTSLRQTASFEPSCMFVRRSVRSLRDCEKKIQKKENKKISKEKKSQSRYISRMRGGALIQPIAIEVCTSV